MIYDLILAAQAIGRTVGKIIATAILVLAPFACISAGEYVADTYLAPLFQSSAETSNTLPPTYEF